MYMTRIDLADAHGGEIIGFKPSASCQVAIDQAKPSAYRGSYMQEAHMDLRVALNNEGMWDASWLAMSFNIPGEVDIDALARVITRYTQRHGVYHGWFTERPDGSFQHYAVAPEDLEFVPEPMGHTESGDETNAYMDKLFTEVCTPFDTLGYTFALVKRDDLSYLYCGMDHCYSDGFSLLSAFNDLTSLYIEETGGPVAELASADSFMEYAQEERLAAEQINVGHSAVTYWLKEGVKHLGQMPKFPMSLGLARGEKRPVAPVRVELLDGEGTRLVAEWAKRHNVGYPPLMLGACALAARELSGAKSYGYLNPVHTRHDKRWTGSMGWFVNLVPIHVRIKKSDTVLDLARKVRASSKKAEKAAEVPVTRVLELLGKYFGLNSKSSDRPPIISYLDGRLIPGQECWTEREFMALTGGGYDDEVNVWINRMVYETAAFCTVPDHPTALRNVRTYFEYVQAVLQELAAEQRDLEAVEHERAERKIVVLPKDDLQAQIV